MSPYQIGQGDKIGGRITRATVGVIVNDTIKSNEIASKVTFECTELRANDTSLTFKELKADTESNIVKVNHKTPKYVYGFVLLSSVALGTYAMIAKFT